MMRLTGPAECRNGGLILDRGLRVACDATCRTRVLEARGPAVVEWRAITAIALDRHRPLARRASRQ